MTVPWNTAPWTAGAAARPDGAIVRASDLSFAPDGDLMVARAVGPHIGARLVTLDVVRLPAGATWSVTDSATERVVLVWAGTGTGTVDSARCRLSRAGALYCPTASSASVRADRDEPVTLYVWQHALGADRPRSSRPRVFGTLWDDATQLKNFAGTGQVGPTDRRATMNFVFWPGTGSAGLCLHCGIQQPGETFSVHLHQHSEDAFIAFEGEGQMFLRNRWIDVHPGDVLFAPPTVLHGARNPHVGPEARRFVTCGGPTPFDTFLYDAAGLSSEVL
jgi:mannose-6-phosphate isomerase-like protein (cupin superfamily)